MKEQPYSLYGVSPTPKIFNTYAVWCVFDIILICSTLGLGVCYAIAVHLGHVHGWTDISGLVINLPERVLFRMIFALTGSLLCVIAFPVRDVAKARVPGSRLHTYAMYGQVVSGIALILVSACGELAPPHSAYPNEKELNDGFV